jgi:hypothetical protein
MKNLFKGAALVIILCLIVFGFMASRDIIEIGLLYSFAYHPLGAIVVVGLIIILFFNVLSKWFDE